MEAWAGEDFETVYLQPVSQTHSASKTRAQAWLGGVSAKLRLLVPENAQGSERRRKPLSQESHTRLTCWPRISEEDLLPVQSCLPPPHGLGKGPGVASQAGGPNPSSRAAPPTLHSPGLGRRTSLYVLLYRVAFCLFNATGLGERSGKWLSSACLLFPFPQE